MKSAKVEFLDTLKKIISDNKLEVEGITEYLTSNNAGVGIEKGSNEGYFVVIRVGGPIEYALRIHSFSESIMAFNCMLPILNSPSDEA